MTGINYDIKEIRRSEEALAASHRLLSRAGPADGHRQGFSTSVHELQGARSHRTAGSVETIYLLRAIQIVGGALPQLQRRARFHVSADGHSGEVHLLLTDVVMPEMNGRQLAEKLKRKYQGLKCLFMSGYKADVVAPAYSTKRSISSRSRFPRAFWPGRYGRCWTVASPCSPSDRVDDVSHTHR